jgi:nitronate monooxygenase
MKTRITELLRIQYPILCGGLFGLSESKLVSSVCNAGGFAFLSSNHLKSKEALREQIRQTKKLTNQSFGVNLSLLTESKKNCTNDYMDVIMEENIRVVETAGNNPTEYIKRLKKKNITVIHKVVTAKHAVKAERAGADAVILVGYEAGGHPGMEEVGLFVNLPQTVRAVRIPVIAAGGICTGEGMASAFLLGAEAILMGTAFAVTKESIFHENIKQKLIQAKSTDTVVILKSIRNAFRCFKNRETEKILEMERQHTSPEIILKYLNLCDVNKSFLEGDVENSLIPIGQTIGLIDHVVSCKELIDHIMEQYRACFKKVQKFENSI